MQHRRRKVPRQAAGWFAKCRLESEPETTTWSHCQVLDVSTVGAGVEILGVVGHSLIGERLVVEVQAPTGATFSVRFVGMVMNAGAVPHGGVRLGLEFVGLSPTEVSILNLFEQMGVGW
jgi:hypothetical protein